MGLMEDNMHNIYMWHRAQAAFWYSLGNMTMAALHDEIAGALGDMGYGESMR